MDNNFEGNNHKEDNNSFSDIPKQDDMTQQPPQYNDIISPASQQNFAQGSQYQGGISPQDPHQTFPQGFSQQGTGQYGNGMPYYGKDISAYPSPVREPKKRRLSNEWLCALISVAVAMFVIIIVLAAAIAITTEKTKENEIPQEGITITKVENDPVRHVDIELPRAEKPVLEDEMYQNKDTGLLTTIGVAELILPSQVKIKIFDEMPYVSVASGSGIVITQDGYILTNAHVVDGAKQIAVIFYDGSEEVGTIVGVDKKSDLAVISVERDDLVPAELGTSSSLAIGEEVALAGAGGGFENTVTYGHVTGLDRKIDTSYMSSSTIHCIQTDAALNPGNSGGALVNMYGQVVGIAVALMNHETYENIGFSIAIDDAAPIAEELISYGYVTSRTRVGITYVSIGDTFADGYGVMSGLCVMEIDPASDAANSGLIPYDIITEIDGVRVLGAEEISDILSGKLPGDTITLTVFRKTITEETSIFKTQVKLSQDTSSISGYSVNTTEQDYYERDIIK